MKTYKIAALLGVDWGWIDVQGEPIKIAGFEDFEWFVYQSGRAWKVGEKTAGSQLPFERRDKETAINAAKTFLQGHGILEVRRVVDLAITKHGGAPKCD